MTPLKESNRRSLGFSIDHRSGSDLLLDDDHDDLGDVMDEDINSVNNSNNDNDNDNSASMISSPPRSCRSKPGGRGGGGAGAGGSSSVMSFLSSTSSSCTSRSPSSLSHRPATLGLHRQYSSATPAGGGDCDGSCNNSPGNSTLCSTTSSIPDRPFLLSTSSSSRAPLWSNHHNNDNDNENNSNTMATATTTTTTTSTGTLAKTDCDAGGHRSRTSTGSSGRLSFRGWSSATPGQPQQRRLLFDDVLDPEDGLMMKEGEGADIRDTDSTNSIAHKDHHVVVQHQQHHLLNQTARKPDRRLDPHASPRRRLVAPTGVAPLDLMQELQQERITQPESDVGVAVTNNNLTNPYLYQGRKRSSAERRGQQTPVKNPYDSGSNGQALGLEGLHGCSMDAASSHDQAMYLSPHISPNSFLTMDGRFVQSKNPFSSPMMTDEDITMSVGSGYHHHHHHHHNFASFNARAPPAFPEYFSSAENKMATHILPPRHARLQQQKRDGSSALYSGSAHQGRPSKKDGYPDKRFSFTGSPIYEGNTAADDALTMMQTDAASSGSLHKVRRLNLSDDVVAASGHHLTSRRKELIKLDTTNSDAIESEISPTEVTQFPPPTPVKVRPSQHAYAYPSIRRQPSSPPPTMDRRRTNQQQISPPPPLASLRTPYPGSRPHDRNNYDDDDCGGQYPFRHDHDQQIQQQQQPKSHFYDDFDRIGHLGKGSFGTVYKVLSRLDGCMYAIKTAHRPAKGLAERERMLQEVYALAALSDQADTATFHIVRYHQAWMEDDRLYIQTELCTGTLSGEIAKCSGPFPEHRRYKLLREMLLALDFIHRHNMVHLDIKPENIFLKNDQYKLGDFGLVTQASGRDDVDEGDSRYMSMELLSGDTRDLTKSDIFSLGATLYEIGLGRPLPINGPEWQDIRAGRLLPLPHTSEDLRDIIHRMMDPDLTRRWPAGEWLKVPQLLSDEQKALRAEQCKVAAVAMQLAAAAQQQQQQQWMTFAGPVLHPPPPTLPPRKGLMRANTWNGTIRPNLM